MTQYNILKIRLSNLQLNKSKSEIKNGTEVTLKLSSTVNGDSNDENNFPHKLLVTNTQVSKLLKTKTILKNIFFETKSFYILLSIFKITIALLVAVTIYCYLIKCKAKQKH